MHQFTIEHLASLCHWSPTHFRRVFHEIMGVPPLDYLNNTRVSKACGLLRSTEESILNISEMVGFRSVSSLNRYFLKIMRMSPRDYRKQMRLSADDAENRSILEYSGWMYPLSDLSPSAKCGLFSCALSVLPPGKSYLLFP